MFCDFIKWNVGYGGALCFYPADGDRVVADCKADRYANWIRRTHDARLVIDDAFLPRALLDALAEGHDPGLDANEAIANADGLSWHTFPEFEFYGENFYTAEGFRGVIGRFKAESGQDVYCMLVAGELEKVAAQAEELGLGVMVTGP